MSQSKEAPCSKQLYSYGLALLTRREMSQKKLLQKLKEKGDAEVAHQVLERLVSEGWASDRRFAESYIRSRIEKGFGPLHIRYQLYGEGVSRQMTEEVFSDLAPDWERLIQQLIDRKFSVDNVSRETLAKLQRFLLSRGFDAGLIRQAMKKESFE